MKFAKSLKLPIKLLISLGIMGVLVMRMDMDILADIALHIHASAWAIAIACILIQLFSLSLRWKWLINVGRFRMSYMDSLQVTLASLLANMLFITSISGIVVRIALALQYGASLFKAVFATAIDRFMTLCALVLLTALFLPGLGDYLDSSLYRAICLYTAIFILGTFIFAPLLANAILTRMPHLARFNNAKITSGLRYVRLVVNDQSLLARVIFVSLVAQMSFFVSIYFLTYAAGTGLSFWMLMTVLPPIALVASLPISFGGWGVREGAFIYGLGLLGVPMETAFLISVQTGLVSMLATILAGIPALLATDMKDAQGRKIPFLNFIKPQR